MMGKIPFKNIDVSYSFSGEGPVVVWLHGYMEDKSIWKNQLSLFNSYCTNVCVDLLGHGETSNVEQEHSMELQAEAVLKVLNLLKIGSFILIGHSMGGYVGLALLEKIKNRISAIVLLNSTSYPDSEEKIKTRKRLLKIVPKQKDAYARIGVVNLFSSDSKVSLEEIENLIEIAKQTSAQGISAALLGMMHRKSRVALLKDFEGDKLIVSGEKDMVLPTALASVEAKRVGAKFIQLSGGHMSYVESRERLNAELKLFFKF